MYVSTGDGVAKVVSDTEVQFLSSCQKSYKGTKVYSFETESETAPSVATRHSTMEELGFKKVGDNMYVEVEDIDEESSSEIETDVSDDTDDDNDDFIVPDDEEVLLKPLDHRSVDAEWNSWRPVSAGARRFKEKVDQIEAYMNHAIDEKFVFKN